MSSKELRQQSNSRLETLKKAYTETGEEARYRHKLMHHSYYLSVIVLGIFLSTAVNQLYSGYLLAFALVCLLASVTFTFIATIIYVNNRKRVAAWAHRLEIETNLSDHDLWRVQQDIIHGRKEHVANEDGKPIFETKEKNWIDSLEAGKIPYIMVFGAAVWFLIGVIAVGVKFLG